MLEKLPPPVYDLLAPTWVWVLGLLGAAVGYFENFSLEDPWKVWILKAITNISSSALAALLTYHFVVAMGITGESMRFVLVGVGSHMGIEALRMMRDVYKARVK